MIVTQRHPTDDRTIEIDDALRYSIDLAVAQHLRSKHGIAVARRALLELGVSDDEIFHRRRAESSDPALAKVLRLAVTLVITRGRLSDLERRNISQAFSARTWQAIVAATTDAYAAIVRAESRFEREPEADVDLEVGDY